MNEIVSFPWDCRLVLGIGLFFFALSFLCIGIFLLLIRRKLTLFSDTLCLLLDGMLNGELDTPPVTEEESLLGKINHRLFRLYEIMNENRRSVAKERADLQELISDISHQVKTPMANLKMLNSTLLEQSIPEEKRIEFIHSMDGQLDKLDFLMESMIKTSRLESGIISPEKKKQPFYDTLAVSLGYIVFHAEAKQIDVTVDCSESFVLSHDRKWTAEALFNILDNAVKYTPVGGSIHISVESWERYLKIDIIDSGKGIPEKHQAEIFKRFYREEDVHHIEGIGIGLYIARKIITMQGGYIKVSSEAGCGSVFSVFLPHE